MNLYQRTGQKDVVLKIIDRKWRWIGHIARKDPQHLTRQCLSFEMEGIRRRGRPRDTWWRVAKREFEEATGLEFEDVVQLAQNWVSWRRHVDAVRTYKAHRVR